MASVYGRKALVRFCRTTSVREKNMSLNQADDLPQIPQVPQVRSGDTPDVQAYAVPDPANPVATPLPDSSIAPSTVQPPLSGPPADTPATSVPSVAQDAASQQASGEPSTGNPSTNDSSTAPSLDCHFCGLDGKPITGAKYRFVMDKTIVNGSTCGEGNTQTLTNLTPGAACQVFLQKDDGQYKQVTSFAIPSTDTCVTLMSPSMLLETETEQHGGEPEDAYKEPPAPPPAAASSAVHPAYTDDSQQDADAAPASPAASPKPAAPASPPSAAKAPTVKSQAALKGGSGKSPAKTTVATQRDAVGHPQAKPTEDVTDWMGQKAMATWHYIEGLFGTTVSPVIGKASTPTKVAVTTNPTKTPTTAGPAHTQALVDIAEEQVNHEMLSASTVKNVDALANGTFKYGDAKPKHVSRGKCYMYVKVALWRINAIHYLTSKHILGQSDAKTAGSFLESEGYVDVTAQLPDARWALPGDVIVYRVKGDTETESGKGQAGHVEIRTYHYYASDFMRNYLCFRGLKPVIHHYDVIGIYRKDGFSDQMALARMRAFLKIIRSREAKTFFTKFGDEKTYFASQGVASLDKGISSFSTFPSGATHQGAYQIARSMWQVGQDIDQGNLPNDFKPETQDRYAIWIMEGMPNRAARGSNEPVPTALGYVRLGDLDNAVRLLRSQWLCLPGTSQDQGYTMDQLKSDFDKYVKEFSV